MTEVVVGELLQPFQLGVHRGIREAIDDKRMNALFYREAKLFFADLSLRRQNGDSDTLKARMIVGG